MRLFILINLQKKDKELILVDNREKAKKTRVIRVITRSYGRSNNGKEQDTSESNLTTTQMKKEAQDHLDLEILISNDVNNIIEKRTNKEHSDSSNISPTSASSLTTNPMRKIINNFRTSINNLSLFEKFQLGYLLFIIIFFILPIVLGNINLFFELVYGMEGTNYEELLADNFKNKPAYKNVNIPVNDLIAKTKAFRESGILDVMNRDPRLLAEKQIQNLILYKIYLLAEEWKKVAKSCDNPAVTRALHIELINYMWLTCNKLSNEKMYSLNDILYSFLVKDTEIPLPETFSNKKNFFGFKSDQTNGELINDFLRRLELVRAESKVTTTTATPATPATTEIYNDFLERAKRLKAQSTVTTTTATTTPTTTTTTTAPVPSTSATTATTTAHVPSTSATTATTTAHVPFSPNMILLPSLRPTVISWFGHYLDPTIATPATSATPATATTAHIQKEAVVSNIDTSSTSANTSTTSANTSNGNEPRRSLLVGRRSPEPLSDHTKKNFGGIGEHYNNFRNSPYFYHITIGTIAVSAVAIGIVIYNYS